jgi:hypothetical protein
LEKQQLLSRKPKLTAVGIRCADHTTPSMRKKLALTSPTSGCISVGIVVLYIIKGIPKLDKCQFHDILLITQVLKLSPRTAQTSEQHTCFVLGTSQAQTPARRPGVLFCSVPPSSRRLADTLIQAHTISFHILSFFTDLNSGAYNFLPHPFFFHWLYSPLGPWPVIFSFMIVLQTVGLLGRGLYLNTE